MRRIKFTVSADDDNRKIKYILRQRMGVSAAILTELKKSPDLLLLNGKSVYVSAAANTGDEIEFVLADEPSPNIVACNMPLDIIYEDEDILAVNKPRAMPCHPSQNHHDDTLANGVAAYYMDQGFTFRVITRLDRDTSGVVIIARNKLAAAVLTQQMTKGQISKEYIAVCHGAPCSLSGTIDEPISRVEGSAILRQISPDGKKAVTNYEAQPLSEDLSLFRLNPVTGRTHQLRVHLASVGCPIYGDDLYGSPLKGERTRLHCLRISLVHPITGKEMIFEAPVPADMEELTDN